MKIQKRHVVLASLVVALAGAVYLNWHFSSVGVTPDSTKELGKATYVNSNVTATVDQASVNNYSNLSKTQQNYFSSARISRDKAADEAVELAMKALEKVEGDEDLKEEALAQLAAVEKTILNENNVETALRAKGFSACICTLSDSSATVVVPENEIGDNSPLVIKDAVAAVCSIPFENINIVTV